MVQTRDLGGNPAGRHYCCAAGCGAHAAAATVDGGFDHHLQLGDRGDGGVEILTSRMQEFIVSSEE